MSFEDNRRKFNHFLKVADADNESETFALINELFAEDYVLHTGGSTLSDAMGKHPKVFDNLYVAMVRAGEIGGVLEAVLNRIADFLEKREALKGKIRSAMMYPVSTGLPGLRCTACIAAISRGTSRPTCCVCSRPTSRRTPRRRRARASSSAARGGPWPCGRC